MADAEVRMGADRPAGWAWPLTIRKAHYFTRDDTVRLCRRVMYLGTRRDPGNDASPDNCAECKRRLAKKTNENTPRDGGHA